MEGAGTSEPHSQLADGAVSLPSRSEQLDRVHENLGDQGGSPEAVWKCHSEQQCQSLWDIFPEEAKELKKGKEAVFPINFVPRNRGARKRRSNGAAKTSRPNDDTELEKALLKGKKRATDDKGQASEKKASRPLRSRKRGCQGCEEGSIAAEGNDWVMFDYHPFIIDHIDGPRRNPLRSNRGSILSGIILSIRRERHGREI